MVQVYGSFGLEYSGFAVAGLCVLSGATHKQSSFVSLSIGGLVLNRCLPAPHAFTASVQLNSSPPPIRDSAETPQMEALGPSEAHHPDFYLFIFGSC